MIVAGIGHRGTASLEDLHDALALTGTTPDALASISAKAHGELMTCFAREMNLPVIAVSDADIAGVRTHTQSVRMRDQFETGSLAEAAALVGAANGAVASGVRLTVPRVQTANGMATAAIAERIRT